MRIIARICLLVGLSVSVYLATVSLTSGTVAGCGGDSPCSKVLTSRWAYVGPVPVSLPAIFAYGLLLAVPAVNGFGKGWMRLLLLGIVTSIVLTVLWFISVQLFIIHQVCPLCMTSHAFGVIGSLLYARDLLADKPRGGKSHPLLPGVATGVILTGCFLTLQVVLPQPHRSVEFAVQTERLVAEVSEEPTEPEIEPPASEESDPAAVESAGESLSESSEAAMPDESPVEEIASTVVGGIDKTPSGPVAPASEEMKPSVQEHVPVYSIHGGEFSFPLDEVPGIGDWRAPNIMLNLIDFACDHCREHYRVLRKRAPWYEEEIFFGVLPLALNERCNPYFSMPGLPNYSNCEYARLALAVWRVAPDQYLEYVDWLCDESSPPASLKAEQWIVAREYAENLIGEELLNQGWSDPWVDQMMTTLTQLYGYNLKLTGRGDIPQQFLNQKLRYGSITSESSFNMIMGMDFPIEIKRRR